MGTSTFILFKSGESINISILLQYFDNLCRKEKFFYSSSSQKYDDNKKLKYCEIYVSDIPFGENYDRQICFGVADEPYDYRLVNFEWDTARDLYFKIMVSGDFYGNEDLLFKVVYGVLKTHPTAKIWIENNWFYTLEDLEKIAENPYDNEWCYKNPSSL